MSSSDTEQTTNGTTSSSVESSPAESVAQNNNKEPETTVTSTETNAENANSNLNSEEQPAIAAKVSKIVMTIVDKLTQQSFDSLGKLFLGLIAFLKDVWFFFKNFIFPIFSLTFFTNLFGRFFKKKKNNNKSTKKTNSESSKFKSNNDDDSQNGSSKFKSNNDDGSQNGSSKSKSNNDEGSQNGSSKFKSNNDEGSQNGSSKSKSNNDDGSQNGSSKSKSNNDDDSQNGSSKFNETEPVENVNRPISVVNLEEGSQTSKKGLKLAGWNNPTNYVTKNSEEFKNFANNSGSYSNSANISNNSSFGAYSQTNKSKSDSLNSFSANKKDNGGGLSVDDVDSHVSNDNSLKKSFDNNVLKRSYSKSNNLPKKSKRISKKEFSGVDVHVSADAAKNKEVVLVLRDNCDKRDRNKFYKSCSDSKVCSKKTDLKNESVKAKNSTTSNSSKKINKKKKS